MEIKAAETRRRDDVAMDDAQGVNVQQEIDALGADGGRKGGILHERRRPHALPRHRVRQSGGEHADHAMWGRRQQPQHLPTGGLFRGDENAKRSSSPGRWTARSARRSG